MKTYTTAIFDLDGTLLNTLDDLTDSVNHVMEQFGFPTHSIREIRRFLGNGIRVLMEKAVPEGTDAETFERAFEAFHAYYTDHCAIKTAPYPGMVEVLRRLKQDGFHTAVVSNKNDEAVKILMEQHFPGLVDSSMGVRDGIRKKPAPDSVLEVMRELGTAREDAVYIGDSEVDKATADNSGLNCISVTWGFRDRELLESLHPYKLVDTAEELYRTLV